LSRTPQTALLITKTAHNGISRMLKRVITSCAKNNMFRRGMTYELNTRTRSTAVMPRDKHRDRRNHFKQKASLYLGTHIPRDEQPMLAYTDFQYAGSIIG